MAGVTEAQASVMRRRRSCNVGGGAYTCPFMCPHKKKPNGVKSGSKEFLFRCHKSILFPNRSIVQPVNRCLRRLLVTWRERIQGSSNPEKRTSLWFVCSHQQQWVSECEADAKNIEHNPILTVQQTPQILMYTKTVLIAWKQRFLF
ncbi:hypothetical protein AVEN_126874-1 [Araneus ventricosus]|uniref:Uncharacterized protein n=1 Tax=Araneus ventricosus TaxID=182803 RepID=A0A4Y2C2I3_ARAVE|nr:hypothetical protein AVEN_126874-1 [Araneus ventricosus]